MPDDDPEKEEIDQVLTRLTSSSGSDAVLPIVRALIQRITGAVSEAQRTGDFAAIVSLSRKAETAYLLASERVDEVAADPLAVGSTFWAMKGDYAAIQAGLISTTTPFTATTLGQRSQTPGPSDPGGPWIHSAPETRPLGDANQDDPGVIRKDIWEFRSDRQNLPSDIGKEHIASLKSPFVKNSVSVPLAGLAAPHRNQSSGVPASPSSGVSTSPSEQESTEGVTNE